VCVPCIQKNIGKESFIAEKSLVSFLSDASRRVRGRLSPKQLRAGGGSGTTLGKLIAPGLAVVALQGRGAHLDFHIERPPVLHEFSSISGREHVRMVVDIDAQRQDIRRQRCRARASSASCSKSAGSGRL